MNFTLEMPATNNSSPAIDIAKSVRISSETKTQYMKQMAEKGTDEIFVHIFLHRSFDANVLILQLAHEEYVPAMASSVSA